MNSKSLFRDFLMIIFYQRDMFGELTRTINKKSNDSKTSVKEIVIIQKTEFVKYI